MDTLRRRIVAESRRAQAVMTTRGSTAVRQAIRD